MANLFDILGPTMVGPSSSHTAGACRLGYVARTILGGTPDDATVGLHGSFAMTGEGHGTRRAIVGGLLGHRPDDPRLRRSQEEAAELGFDVEFEHIDLGEDAHPNSVRIEARRGDDSTRLEGASIGGGRIRVSSIDGYPVALSGSLPALVVLADDVPGTIASIAGLFAERELNLATMRVDRTGRGEQAMMTIEVDGVIPEALVETLRAQPWAHWARCMDRLG